MAEVSLTEGAPADAGVGSYGSGADGVASFDGTTTVAGMVPSTNVYTLGRDYFFTNGTVANSITIVTNGFRLFFQGTLTGGGASALIQHNGVSASGTNGATGGTALANTNSSITSRMTPNCLSTAGANGGTGNGASGTNAGSSIYTLGGRGGTGGTGAASTAGVGGTLQNAPATNMPPQALPVAVTLQPTPAMSGLIQFQGGTGGGAGGGDATNNGGGAGSGGGVVGVYARTFAGAGAIQARGGAGGTVTVSALGAGGGAGGGGGLVVVVSQSVRASAIAGWTIDAAGGAAGTGLGVTFTNGSPGAVGTVILLQN